MTFKDNFITVVKCNGRILREDNGFVTLPFDSEYSIYLKNLDSRKAVVDISIDGKDVLDNSRLIVYPDTFLELEGFKKNNKVENKFKFIKKTEEIVNHRGDRVDDGIIRVEVTFEKFKVEQYIEHVHHHFTVPYIWHYPYYTCNMTSSDSFSVYGGTISCNTPTSYIKNDEGITVKGSEGNQQFIAGSTNELENQSRVIILKLRGKIEGVDANMPITTQDKKVCETCGKRSNYLAKFCSRCGTYL
jgi:hypothetical protein